MYSQSSVEITTLGLNYSQVCGHIRGYQAGCPRAFELYNSNPALSIDDHYVDGVSITTKTIQRKHIWTYMLLVLETVTLPIAAAPVIIRIILWYQTL